MWLYRKLSNLLSKLVVVNSLVIFLVILLAGFSVKDYACFLVNSEKITGSHFVQTLNNFLWKVSIVAFVIAGLFHYITVRNIVGPITKLSKAANQLKEGRTPSRVEVSSSGELKELTENFNSMAETLRSVHEKREEMLKDIAHELRTPLTNINGYLEALQNGVIEGDPELFGSLLEESRRITRIVELINELNSWGNGMHFEERTFHQIEIDKVLGESIHSFDLKIREKFTDIYVDIEHAFLVGNKDGLMQVFTNILQNTLDYNIGEVLTIKGKKENDKYFITFSHTGQFIDPEKKEFIFERFYRLEESRSTKSDGAGLGLAIAKSIVSAHEGTIGLKTDGNRHTFWISFPYGKRV